MEIHYNEWETVGDRRRLRRLERLWRPIDLHYNEREQWETVGDRRRLRRLGDYGDQ